MSTDLLERDRGGRTAMFDGGAPSAPLAAAWRKQIRLALDFRGQQFDKDASECLRLFDGDHSFLWDAQDPRSFLNGNRLSRLDAPDFVYAYGGMAMVVQLFGPTIYHKNPFRQVNPREPINIPQELMVDPELVAALQAAQQQLFPPQPPGTPPPQTAPGQPPPQPPANPQVQALMMQLQSQLQAQQQKYSGFIAKQKRRYARDRTESILLQRLLNYTPNALDLAGHSRRWVDEALLTGLSWMWTELFQFPGSRYVLPGSFWVSSADVVLDPDASCMQECLWLARRSIHPTWLVERKFGKKRGSISGNLESLAKQSQYGNEDWANSVNRRNAGMDKDLCVYWELYSKMGMGGRLNGIIRSDIAEMLEDCGDNVYLAVADGYRGLLSVPDKVMKTEDPDEVFPYVQWPTSFWADNQWPATPLYFHEVPNQIYPASHMRPAIAQIRFIDFVMSFIGKKCYTCLNDLMGVVRAAADELKASLTRRDIPGYIIVEIEQHLGKSIPELISYIQAPPFHGDIWKMLAAMMQDVEKLLGINELAFGSGDRQMRSAKEAEVKQQNFSVRPEDMQQKAEAAATLVARKEAICAREHLEGDDVLPVLGPEAAQLWDELVVGRDLDSIMREFDYRIEENSIRKPNRDRDTAVMQQFFQPLLAVLEKAIGMNPANVDVLNGWIDHALSVFDLQTADIPHLQGPPADKPDPKMAEIEAKLELLKAQIAGRQQETQANIAERAQEAQVRQATAQIEEARAQTELEHARAATLHDQLAAKVDMAQDAAEHRQGLLHQRETHELKQSLLRQSARQRPRQPAGAQ